MIKDELNMIPQWAFESLSTIENNDDLLMAKLTEFSRREPLATQFVNSCAEEIASAMNEYIDGPDFEESYATNMLKTMCWKFFYRGLFLSDSKWVSKEFSLPDEPQDKDPKRYMPKPKDFL